MMLDDKEWACESTLSICTGVHGKMGSFVAHVPRAGRKKG